MGLYEFHRLKEQPSFPVRRKEDVLAIVTRWEDGPYDDDECDSVDWTQLEQDLHALAAVAMEALPD